MEDLTILFVVCVFSGLGCISWSLITLLNLWITIVNKIEVDAVAIVKKKILYLNPRAGRYGQKYTSVKTGYAVKPKETKYIFETEFRYTVAGTQYRASYTYEGFPKYGGGSVVPIYVNKEHPEKVVFPREIKGKLRKYIAILAGGVLLILLSVMFALKSV